MRRIIHLIAFATSAAAQTCGSESQVLFQSNAYTDSDTYHGVSILETQVDWDTFLNSFLPETVGESIVSTSIDFSTEKVVIGSYFTYETCFVQISNAKLECATSGADVQMKMIMDVFDSSIDCEMKCGMLGQVIYAVAIPSSWQVDGDTFQINVSGPCLSGQSIVIDTTTTRATTTTTDEGTNTTGATTTTTDELITSSSNVLATTTQSPIILTNTETVAGSTISNDIAISIAQNTTPTTTEPTVIETSQLRGTVSTHDTDAEGGAMPTADSDIADASSSGEVDTTTTTPAQSTDASTTTTTAATIATKQVIPIPENVAPPTRLASKATSEPENAAIMVVKSYESVLLATLLGLFYIAF